MLHRLQIENFALIEQAILEFGPGFNVLTGETGSGKSMVVDALGLLLGERADPASIRSGAPQASVSGVFTSPFAQSRQAHTFAEAHGLDDFGDEILLRREITNAGRSRAFIDNQPATLAVVRKLAAAMGEIHSQHESLGSFSPAEQLQLLDRFAGLGTAAAAAAFEAWREADGRCRDLRELERARLQQADLWRFQLQEIDALRPRPGEDIELDAEQRRLANAERIVSGAQTAYGHLYDAPDAVVAQLKTVERQLADLRRYEDAVGPLVPRLAAAHAEIEDVAALLRDLAESIDASSDRLIAVDERLGALDRIKRKYGPELADVVVLRDSIATQLDLVDNAAFHLREAEIRVQAARLAFVSEAASLSRSRRAAAQKLAQRVAVEVADLAMQLKFQVQFDSAADAEPGAEAWGTAGWDRIRFIAATNPGEPLLPVDEIASGGELSRLLLALHVLAKPKAGAGRRTLVLDEVDAGIGGRAADAVGEKLQRLGAQYQVLCVTHLPQIATFAGHHLRVEKVVAGGRTRTHVLVLSSAARVEEIARMLAGNQLNPTSLKHARELLAAHAG